MGLHSISASNEQWSALSRMCVLLTDIFYLLPVVGLHCTASCASYHGLFFILELAWALRPNLYLYNL